MLLIIRGFSLFLRFLIFYFPFRGIDLEFFAKVEASLLDLQVIVVRDENLLANALVQLNQYTFDGMGTCTRERD